MRIKRARRGDIRIRRRFLLIPRTNNYETRWLEFATIKEEYKLVASPDGYPSLMWCEIGFID